MRIDDKTSISIPLVLSFIGAFIGAILWLTSIYIAATTALAKADELNRRYDSLQIDTTSLHDKIGETNQRLSAIDGKLDLLLKQAKQ